MAVFLRGQGTNVERKIQARKIKNYVNVHNDSVKISPDFTFPGSYLVSFTFDALIHGSFTLYFFAKEDPNCAFTPLYPQICPPKKAWFTIGYQQRFSQPYAGGTYLGFFNTDDLTKPFVQGDIFPFVISAEVRLPSPRTQFTLAIFEKKQNEAHLRVKVVKQILWANGVRYELRDIYGITNSNLSGSNERSAEEGCVVCMNEAKDTLVMPCRHMYMCSGCAREVRSRSMRCPVCRQHIQELLRVNV